MYEIDFSGFTRTPESLEDLRVNKKYRRYHNWMRFVKSIRYKRGIRETWNYFGDWLFNRNNF